MAFDCERKALMAALGLARRAIAKKTTLPILRCVLLHAQGQTLRVVGTDMETALTQHIEIAAKADGAVCVDLETLLRRLKETTAPVLHFEKQGEALQITAGNVTFSVETLDARSFPVTRFLESEGEAEKETAHRFTAPVATFAELFEPVFAASKDDARVMLQGLNLTVSAESVEATATNRHHLAVCTLPRGCFSNLVGMSDGSYLIPFAPLKLLPLLTKKGGDMRLDLRSACGEITPVGANSLAFRIPDGVFPDYRAIVTRVRANRLVVNCTATALITALKIADAGNGKNDPMPMVRVIAEPGQSLAVESSDAKTRTTLAAYGNIAQRTTICFNAHYAIDALRRFAEGAEVQIALHADDPVQNPLTISSATKPHFLYVLMPMRDGAGAN